jgi:branched-chain amino acid transport system permease protein
VGGWAGPARQARGWALCLVLALLVGFLVVRGVSAYWVSVLGAVAVAGIASIGLNLLIGNAGLISLATPAFMAVGAYGAGILLLHSHVTIVGAVIIPVVVAVIAGGLLGLLALRLRGFYLGLATLGLLEAIQWVLNQGGTLFGSGYGFAMPIVTVGGYQLTYLDWCGISAGFLVLVAAGAVSIRRSALGRGLALMREHEMAAGCTGMNIVMMKVGAFALSAGLGALAGVLMANVEGAVSPTEFSLTLAVSQLAFIIFGGLGTVSGAIVGTAVLTLLPEYFRSVGQNEGILYAAVLLAMVIVAPRGIVPLAIDSARRIERRLSDSPPSWYAAGQHVTRRVLRRPTAGGPAAAADAPSSAAADLAARLVVRSRPPAPEEPGAGRPSPIAFEKAEVRYGGVVAVSDFDFDLRPGTVHGLIGPNGAGKSSAVAALFGLVKLTAGRVSVNGVSVQSSTSRVPPWTVARRGVGRTFQTPAAGRGLTALESVENGLFPQLQAGYIRSGLRTSAVSAGEVVARQSALEALELVRFAGDVRRPVEQLSLGELRMVELARVLAARPAVIVLDEPTSGMEMADSAALFSLLRDLTRSEERAVLVVEHNVRLIFEYCDDVTVMGLGRVIATGPPVAIAGHAAVKEAYLGHA